MNEALSSEEIRTILFSNNEDTRQEFIHLFRMEIDNFVTEIAQSYNRLQEMQSRVPNERRSAWVDAYLFSAFNSLLTSIHLLISGLSIPAGNLMRHYGEATAMALLLSHRAINTYDRLEKNREFPVQKVMEIVKQKHNKKLLGLNWKGWDTFNEITSFYSQHSHASVFATASAHIFSSPGSRQIGGEFDLGKKTVYQKEILRAISAARVLCRTIEVAEGHLISSMPTNKTL